MKSILQEIILNYVSYTLQYDIAFVTYLFCKKHFQERNSSHAIHCSHCDVVVVVATFLTVVVVVVVVVI